MEVSRSPHSAPPVSTQQVDKKNREHSVQRQQTQQADRSQEAQKEQQAQRQQHVQTEQRAKENKPVVNTQGETTGRILNATA